MRKFLLSLLTFALVALTHADPFEIKDGDRVLFLGDTLLEREGTYGYLETRMVEQFPDRKFTVRNLAFSADTPLGWSRASFDPAAKGFERLKEQLALVKPTVVFLGYGMAASLQEMTDRSQDWTLNRDPARYGAEPMSAARFKKELAQCMDLIEEVSADSADLRRKDGASPASENLRPSAQSADRKSAVRFVLLSPIRHEDLRATRPGLPDPTEHNKLLEQYTKAIEELAKERGARFVPLNRFPKSYPVSFPMREDGSRFKTDGQANLTLTDNGIHATEQGYMNIANGIFEKLGLSAENATYYWPHLTLGFNDTGGLFDTPLALADGVHQLKVPFQNYALRTAIIRKNALFFHRWRPANETYLFGFRKREQGQNAVEIPKFDPLIEAAEAEIERLKKAPKGLDAAPAFRSPMPRAPKGADGAPAPDDAKTAQARAASACPDAANPQAGATDLRPDAANPRPDVANLRPNAASNTPKSAAFQPKTPVFTSTGRLYAANDTPATGNQPSVTSYQSPVTAAPDLSRQTPAETPDLSKVAAPQSTLPHPDFTLADGLEISLWAENPLLAKPTEVNWDAQGRLWVASSALYPMIAPGQEATDKIIIIEDPGHTGKATKATVFADGLLIPTGVAPVLLAEAKDEGGRMKDEKSDAASPQNGKQTAADGQSKPSSFDLHPSSLPRWGCYVGQSTELLYFEDTKGTGKADKKRIVFSGFGTEDTHHIVHTLRWGPDGRLYFSQSVYIHTHMETPWGVVRVNSGGVFAYDPRTERVEVVEKGLWNTWGHAWDQWGQPFYTDGAGSTGLSWGFPGATFAPNEGARRTMASISPGSYPKFAGLEIIYSPHFPADWQGTAVTCDFRAHKVVHFKINDLGNPQQGNPQISQISADGRNAGAGAANPAGNSGTAAQSADPSASNNLRKSAQSADNPSAQSADNSSLKSGYVTDQLPVLVQTSDATFRPIDVKLGPDGAIYIADWSNPIINHGEVDFRDPRRDHEHGRIWRLSMKGGAAVKWESLVGSEPKKLLEQTMSPSLWESAQANQAFVQTLESPKTADAARAILNEAIKQPAHLKVLKAVRLNRTLSSPTADFAPIGEMLTGNNANLATAAVPYFDPAKSDEATKLLGQMQREASGDTERKKKDREIRSRLTPLLEALKKDPARENELKDQIQALTKEFADNLGASKERTEILGHSKSWLVSNTSPRARIAAMRTLARTPTIENAAHILTAAINAPKDDPQYEFAAWLSINDLAEVWTKAVLAGEWKPEGREKQFEFALNAIEPALAGQVLSQFVSTGRAPLDGSGPWIELIGNTGGPGELRPLLDALLASTTGMMPLADPKPPFKTPGANTRAAAALVAAARRGVKPAGGMPPWQFYMGAPPEALPDVLRLAGLWKQNFPAAMFDALDTKASAPVLDAAFEALRTLATPEAADFLTAYFDPAMEQKLGNAALHRVIAKSDTNWRIHALLALAPLRPGEAMKHLDTVLAETPEPQRVNVWRTLFAEGPFMQKFMQSIPANFPPATAATALRAARELGRRGQPLVAKLSPLAGEKAATATAPANYADLGARAKKDGDPVAGEAIYRRMASACTTCHAIGGAGGKLGPDLTSIGASAPADYIIESVLDPAAKVKEGFHAFAFKMKDGSEAIGIPSRETATEQFIRTLAGEQALPKANIVSKKLAEGGASLMPAGLTAAWSDRERLNLYAFLMELGRPGPFDASKNNVARAWMLTDTGATEGALKVEAATSAPSIPAYTLVDGRLTKDLLAEKLTTLAPKNATVHLTARFQAASAGQAKLNLTGIRKAWLDGQPLAIASEPSPSVELTAGEHTFTVEVDAKSPPEVVRLESPAASFLGE